MNANTFARPAFFMVVVCVAYAAGRMNNASMNAVSAAAASATSTRVAVTATPALPLQRRAFRFRIHPEKAAGYKAWHKRASPQLLRDLSRAGVRNYSLHLAKDGTVFGYMESHDWDRVNREMAKSKADAPWQKIMKPYIVQPTKPGESSFSSLEEVFYLR
jgi:L-rhamnose mutarotase